MKNALAASELNSFQSKATQSIFNTITGIGITWIKKEKKNKKKNPFVLFLGERSKVKVRIRDSDFLKMLILPSPGKRS